MKINRSFGTRWKEILCLLQHTLQLKSHFSPVITKGTITSKDIFFLHLWHLVLIADRQNRQKRDTVQLWNPKMVSALVALVTCIKTFSSFAHSWSKRCFCKLARFIGNIFGGRRIMIRFNMKVYKTEKSWGVAIYLEHRTSSSPPPLLHCSAKNFWYDFCLWSAVPHLPVNGR